MDYAEKIKSLQLEADAAEKLRAELEAKRAEGKGSKRGPKSRGPKDSGKGVRVQVRRRVGGRPPGPRWSGAFFALAARWQQKQPAGRAHWGSRWGLSAPGDALAAPQTPHPPPNSPRQGGRVYDSTFGVTCHW